MMRFFFAGRASEERGAMCLADAAAVEEGSTLPSRSRFRLMASSALSEWKRKRKRQVSE